MWANFENFGPEPNLYHLCVRPWSSFAVIKNKWNSSIWPWALSVFFPFVPTMGERLQHSELLNHTKIPNRSSRKPLFELKLSVFILVAHSDEIIIKADLNCDNLFKYIQLKLARLVTTDNCSPNTEWIYNYGN